MSENPWLQDLPAIRVDDLDLPILSPTSGPQHQTASVLYPGWFNLASQLHINAIAIHPLDDTIWLATAGGVLRWAGDRSTFTRYSSEHGLPGNAIAHITIDTSGQVWAASEMNVNYFDGERWQPYFSIDEQPIHCMTCSNAGTIHIAAGSNVYTLTDPHTIPAVIPLPLGTPPRAIAVTLDQGVWLCNARGLYHWEEDHWQGRLLQSDLLVLEITQQYLWIGAANGLIGIDLLQDKIYRLAEWPDGVVMALATGPDETSVWVACGGKLGLATPTSWKMRLNYTQIGKTITCLASAHHLTLWIGTPDGPFIASPTGIEKCTTDSPPDVIGLPSQKKAALTFCNLVQALAVQESATTVLLWIGTSSHLYCLDLTTEHWRCFAHLHDVRACIANPNADELVVASWGEGVYHLLERSQITQIPITPPALALAEGTNNTYWAVSLDGLYRNPGELVLSSQELVSSGWIQTLVQTTSGYLWLGTNAGLFRYHPATRLLERVSGIPGTLSIRALLISSSGDREVLWIGTECGLYKGQATSLQAEPVLVDIAITALSRDEQAETIWVGTEQGLTHILDHGDQCTTEQYTTQNSGLAANHITALAYVCDDDGNNYLWIGTSNGLSGFKY